MSRMAALSASAKEFPGEVARALSLLGEGAGSPAADALLDPAGAARSLHTLADGGSLLLRAAPELRAEAAGYAPVPADPVWLKIAKGSAAVATAPLRARAKEGEKRRAEARAIAVETREEP